MGLMRGAAASGPSADPADTDPVSSSRRRSELMH
jgi:hypothetical protein